MEPSDLAFRVINFDDSLSHDRPVHKRRFSRKLRSGCLSCKLKRVKCDESKPTCARCNRNRWSCQYPSHEPPSRTSHRTPHHELPRLAPTPTTQIREYLYQDCPKGSAEGTPITALMQHLLDRWIDILHFRYSEEIIVLAKGYELVRRSLLALAASHLRHLAPGVVQHRIAEHYHQKLALCNYKIAVNNPMSNISQSKAIVLLLGGALLNVLAFTTSTTETSQNSSDLFNHGPGQLDWLVLQMGLKPFILSMSPYFDDSVVFLSRITSDEATGIKDFAHAGPPLDGIPDLWVKVFGLTSSHGYEPRGSRYGQNDGLNDGLQDAACNSNDIFFPAVKTLSCLIHMDTSNSSLYKHLRFIAKVSPEFRMVLYQKNIKALWLYGYWLGLMCRFKSVWWCKQRVNRDYKAVLAYMPHAIANDPEFANEEWEEMMDALRQAPYL